MTGRTPTPSELRERAETAPGELSPDAVRRAVAAEDWGTVEAAADALATVAERDPEHLDPLLDAVAARLDAPDPGVRNRAATVFGTVAVADPAATSGWAPVLADCLDDEFTVVRAAAAEAMAAIAAEDAQAVAPTADRFPGAIGSDLPRARRAGLAVAEELAATDPAALAPLTGDLVAVVEHPPEDRVALGAGGPTSDVPPQLVDHRDMDGIERALDRGRAARALAALAEADPDALAGPEDDPADSPATRLAKLAATPEGQPVRIPLLQALATLAEADPDVLAPAVEPLSELLAAGEADPDALALAARVLGLAAESVPAAVESAAPAVPALETLVESDAPGHRGAAVGLLAYVAEHRPEAVAPLTGRCVDLLEPSEPWFVRANAARTLGVAELDTGEAEDVSAALRRTADEDPHEGVREAATRALDHRLDRGGSTR